MIDDDGIKTKSYSYDRKTYTKFTYDEERKKYIAKMYKSKSNTTDYAYIDEETGDYILNPKYSGYWFNVDYVIERGGFDYKTVSWENNLNKNPYHVWPWDISEGNCLKAWWFSDDFNDKQSHIQLYFHYFSWPNKGEGYWAITDPAEKNYKNQSLGYENQLFSTKGLVKNAISNRKEREDIAEHIYVKRNPKYYKISMNILNGDGVNKTGAHGNKIIYINEYELNDKDGLPIRFRIETTENIEKIELLKGDGVTNISTYMPYDSSVSNSDPYVIKKGSESFTIDNITKTGDKFPEDSSTGVPLYTYEGKIDKAILKDWYSTGVNNSFKFRVTIEPLPEQIRTATDTITVVVRTFYNLN